MVGTGGRWAGGLLARPARCLPPLLCGAVRFFWSPSHFWSLAIAYKSEYAGARIPMLPAVKGEAETARMILLNTLGLLGTSLLPFLLGLLGLAYLLIGVLPGGSLMLQKNLRMVRAPSDRRLAMANFHASNLFLLLLFSGVVADVVLRRL